jgi:glucose/arabinose dehydrogenase
MPRPRRLAIWIVAGLCLLALPASTAAQQPPRIELQPMARGFRQPVHVVAPPDGSGRLFVVERAGRIRIALGGETLPVSFLDLTPIVGSRGTEQGLLGLAFHPRYVENGFFYVNYTDLNGDTVIARYQVSFDPNVGDPGTGKVLLWIDQPAANHNGGNLLFGPDGYLWIGLGDGGGSGDVFGNGQNPGSLLGKMLRIDVDNGDPYAIPADNPFVGSLEWWWETWAYGLRNPWRYSFDRATGDLWIGDVGQNAWEEVTFTPAGTPGGRNYGWPIMEATHCFRGSACDPSGLEQPVAEYPTREGGCAVTGGFVYRGQAFPNLAGTYLFADYCSGRLWALQRDPAGAWRMVQVLDTGLQISSFGEDEAGELYVAGFGDGVIYRVAAP